MKSYFNDFKVERQQNISGRYEFPYADPDEMRHWIDYFALRDFA